ncbi:Uncharacterized conserved protein [Bacillus sp. OV322]|uniref:motility associated factor glycosyltransferase family protein n=1 Tax=Bacillus sp. OV322 TaxID=1882764 RepID=UPI0008E74294|nr:6-hydroxymethylpterin diphosphokinase MptE-like protein [Bacillus sp. OV322]SFC24133.1 Uncharacterized conserved protein [Bacillus sp. OV322]
MLIENRNYLRLHHRMLLEQINNNIEEGKEVIIEPSKNGSPTMKICLNNNNHNYIHSRYNPENEAIKMIDQLEGLDEYNHIIFVGTGLGYHIKEFSKRYPNISISIFEPNLEVLHNFLAFQSLSDFTKGQIKSFITSQNNDAIRLELQKITNKKDEKIFVYTLPSLSKQYSNEEKIILNTLKELLKGKKSNLATNVSFQKRWTINSIKNFPVVIKTPNILQDIDKTVFKDKPAIIVAAGPSLNEEIENLRYIKENGLAYIFSVGSAINALIENGIYPDAACTYDPQGHNYKVIQILKDRGIKNIPLIFGSSVGFETLDGYPGNMLHMIMNQDSISQIFFKDYKEMDIVLDAPSIAVVMFQVLCKLECNPIILAGQNLSFQHNKRYANGIKYDFISTELSEEQQKKLITIKDVNGNSVYTDDGYNSMRRELEMYIGFFHKIDVINTTKGGANIQGASFKTLQEVISTKLTQKNTIDKEWYKGNSKYNLDYINIKNQQLKETAGLFEKQMKMVASDLLEINSYLQKKQLKNMERKFNKFDKSFNEFWNNEFYNSFIAPIFRVHTKRLEEEIQTIKFEGNLEKKGLSVVELFSNFLNECQAIYQFVLPFFEELNKSINDHCLENSIKM